MELEMAAQDEIESFYEYAWDGDGPVRILTAPIVRGVVEDVGKGRPLSAISAKFHGTLIRLLADLCDRIRRERGLKRVALSGGVFQNARLLTGLVRALEAKGFDVFSHRQVPTNDGGIALGQAVVAATRMGQSA
jgi:hydrogenase maturation protein HypF